jgi:O-antigen/teichoic acid export membrane protein
MGPNTRFFGASAETGRKRATDAGAGACPTRNKARSRCGLLPIGVIDSLTCRGAKLASPFHNILRLSVGDFVAKTLNFLAFIYLARVFSVQLFGVLEFANALLTYFLLLADAGLEVWATREMSQTQDAKGLAGRVLPLRFLAATFSFGVLLSTLPFLPDHPYFRAVLLIFGLTVFAQAGNLKWVFMGQQRMALVAGGLVLSQIVFAACVLGFIRRPEQVLWAPMLRFASEAALACYFLYRFSKAHGGLRLPLKLSGAGAVLRPALTMGFTNAMGLLNYNFDSLLLGFLKGPQLVAWYSAGYRPVTVALQLPLTYFQGLFPALSQEFARDRAAFERLVQRSMRLCAVFALPLGVGGTMLAEPLVTALFGAGFRESAAPMSVLVWSAALVILRGSLRHGLNAAGQQHLDLRCAFTSTMVNVGLNLALIPRYGMIGAATATVLADFVWFARAWGYFHRRVLPVNPLKAMMHPALAAAGMGIFLHYGQAVHWIPRGLLATAVYFGLLWAMGEPEVRSWARHLRRSQ